MYRADSGLSAPAGAKDNTISKVYYRHTNHPHVTEKTGGKKQKNRTRSLCCSLQEGRWWWWWWEGDGKREAQNKGTTRCIKSLQYFIVDGTGHTTTCSFHPFTTRSARWCVQWLCVCVYIQPCVCVCV
jgi:hypothetical protein